MRIGLCDDDSVFLNYLLRLMKQYFVNDRDTTLSAFMPDKLNSYIEASQFPFDIFITDIDMGKINGIKITAKINRINSSCIIIFLSNYINFATEVYDVRHIYFVLKSQLEERLPKAIDKALALYRQRASHYLTIRYQNREFLIPLEDILYMEALGRYLYIHTATETIKSINTLKDISHQLTDEFIRCHHSYIVNFSHIRSVSRTECVLTANHKISISQTYSKSFQAAYVQFVSRKLS